MTENKANKQFNFTKQSISKLPPPLKGMTTYRDTKEKGLSLYITSTGSITFFVRKRINGRDERINLGNFPEVTVENARKKALQAKAEVAGGRNPNHEKHKMRSEITFKQLFDDYMTRYSKKEKRSWQYDEREVNKFLPHWFKRKISSINKFEVQNLHEKIREENGLYQANRILERIRAIFNKAIEWGWDGKNPAQGIKKFKEKSRDRFIKPSELPFFFEALNEEQNKTACDYLLISLYTGARKSNVLSMRWAEINFQQSEWRIPETKNGEPLTIALSNEAIDILKRRQRETNQKWVFPSDRTDGHLADPKKAWKRILTNATIKFWEAHDHISPLVQEVKKQTNNTQYDQSVYVAIEALAENKKIELPIGLMDIRIHDLRRTLGSFQAAAGANQYIIGQSLGHKSQQATAVYARLDLDPVRASVQLASSAISSAGNGERDG